MVEIVVLRDVLDNPHQEFKGSWLFLPKDAKWDLNTKGVFLELDSLPPNLLRQPVEISSDPTYAETHHLRRVLNIDTIQDIVDNAKAQNSRVTIGKLFDAFIYYYKFDAFIDLMK